MRETIRRFYRNGRIELLNRPPPQIEEARVLVTFLESGEIDLVERGIAKEQAPPLRLKLAAFAEDWTARK